MSDLEIISSKEAAVCGKWSDPGAKFYDDLLSHSNWKNLLEEAYLIAPVHDINNTTPYSRSGCKYPHHVIRDNKLVLHEAGVKAAYARAKQQGIFKGEFKEHLERHYRELGLYDGSTMQTESKIQENFEFIESYILEKEGVNMEDNLDWIEGFLMEADEDAPPDVTSAIMQATGMNKRVAAKKAEKKAIADMGAPPEVSDASEPEDIEEPDETEDKPSRPKQVDKAYSDKNGVRRKQLYIAFIEYAKALRPKNTFGSVFDKDAFNVTYPFVPDELRYFYRLANPLLCVLDDNLTFFALSELKKINTGNNFTKFIVFAGTEEQIYLFHYPDKKIYRTSEDISSLVNKTDLKPSMEELAPSFDEYLEQIVGKQILNAPLEQVGS